MNRRELRRQVKAQRAELKARVAAERAAAKAQLRAYRSKQNAERDRRRSLRRRITLLIILVIILLLLRNCDCDTPIGPGGPPPPDGAPAEVIVDAAIPPDAAPPRKRRTKSRVRLKPTDRPTFDNPPPAPMTWLDALRLQVSARGPRLARCFEGTDRPGALKWASTVDIDRGVVSDHSFEPILAGADLPAKLRRCLQKTLTTPPYTLPRAPDVPPKGRASLVIEF